MLFSRENDVGTKVSSTKKSSSFIKIRCCTLEHWNIQNNNETFKKQSRKRQNICKHKHNQTFSDWHFPRNTNTIKHFSLLRCFSCASTQKHWNTSSSTSFALCADPNIYLNQKFNEHRILVLAHLPKFKDMKRKAADFPARDWTQSLSCQENNRITDNNTLDFCVYCLLIIARYKVWWDN